MGCLPLAATRSVWALEYESWIKCRASPSHSNCVFLSSLTDRGTEYCGNPEHHEYELYLAVENIDHSRTKAKSPQTNGIVERLHKTMLNEFYRLAFRKKLYASIGELQDDLDEWIKSYNEERPHQGRWCFGKTPTQTFLDAIPIAREKKTD